MDRLEAEKIAATEQTPSASEFCGIWSDDHYPDAALIRNFRTQNTFPEL